MNLVIYSGIDILPNRNILDKIVRVAAFDTVGIGAFNYLYRIFLYFRDEVGLKKTVKGLFNLRIMDYLLDAHRKEVIPNWYPATKQAALTFSPIHMFSLNFVENPYLRIAIGNVNEVLYRFLMGGRKVPKNYVIWKDLCDRLLGRPKTAYA